MPSIRKERFLVYWSTAVYFSWEYLLILVASSFLRALMCLLTSMLTLLLITSRFIALFNTVSSQRASIRVSHCKFSTIYVCHHLFQLCSGRASMACISCNFLMWWRLNACDIERRLDSDPWSVKQNSPGLECPHVYGHIYQNNSIFWAIRVHQLDPDMSLNVWNEYQQPVTRNILLNGWCKEWPMVACPFQALVVMCHMLEIFTWYEIVIV